MEMVKQSRIVNGAILILLRYLYLQPKVNFHELYLSRKKCANSLMHTRSVLKAQFKYLVLDCII